MPNTNCSLLAICLYLLTFVIVLPVICFLLPLHHSVYYQLLTNIIAVVKPDSALQMDVDMLIDLIVKNTERVDFANRFFKHQQSHLVLTNISTLPVKFQPKTQTKGSVNFMQNIKHVSVDARAAVTVSVVIISAGRDSVVSNGAKYAPCYLTQNVARFLTLIGKRRQSNQVLYQLLVCSVGDHVTAEEQSVSHLVQLVRDPHLDSGFTFGPFHDILAWRFEKEKRDYIFCLRQAAHDAKFVLIVEDDALPVAESLSVISRLVTGQWTSRPDSHIVGERFYVKLYHPVHLQGYMSLESERLPQLIAAAVVLGSCLYLATRWRLWRTDVRSLARGRLSWIHCCIYCGLIALCIGRVHMHSWRRLLAPYAHYLVSNKFCCTQAILYTSQTACDLAAYLERTSCNETYHKDEALWTFTTSGYLMQPNVFEHVGVWSSVRSGFVDPHTVD